MKKTLLTLSAAGVAFASTNFCCNAISELAWYLIRTQSASPRIASNGSIVGSGADDIDARISQPKKLV